MSTVAAVPATLKVAERINRIEPSATMAVVAEADKLRQSGVDVIDMSVGEPHFSTPQHIKDAAIAAINGNFTRYTAVGGTVELKDAILQRHGKDFGSRYKREETMASVGGKHVLFNAIQVLVDHGDEVILPVPYWVSFKDIVRYAGGNCVLLQSDEAAGFRVTAEMVARLVTPRTKLIILNSPSNPSGAVVSPEDMTEVVRFAAERGIWVISDECYVYLNYTGREFSVGSLNDYRDRMVVVGSLSKTYAMTGWRMGYGVMRADLATHMSRLMTNSNSCTATFTQRAGIEAIKGDQSEPERFNEEFKKRRDVFVKGLNQIKGFSCRLPHGAFYTFPNIKQTGWPSKKLADALLEQAGVAALSGTAFGGYGEGYLRFSIANSMENLNLALDRVDQWTKKNL